ncbi:MAG: hybrid sensor histidine kinase/response regulator [Chloroflexi bacterium]|nr:hybrid sensor histidine kinase/response regulator [Chloroflexota bacterium]
MWSHLLWWRRLHQPTLAREIAGLRQDTVWFLLSGTAIAFVIWHILRIPIDGDAATVFQHSLRHWMLFIVVMGGLGLTLQLQRHRPGLAPAGFLITAALSVTMGGWLFGTPVALVFVPALTLAAMILLHPFVGLLFAASLLSALAALSATGPLAFLSPDQLAWASLASLLVAAVAWALGRVLTTATEALTASHAEAWRHAQEARANRAELVQALKQLDYAYYRIQRANASLELAWKAAEAAERGKSEFVTNISHELRTPLNLIIGFSEMILMAPESYHEPLPVAYRGDLHAIYRSAQHLLTLTNDVIDLARVGMDRLALIREPLDIGDIIGDACAIVRAYIETKGLTLRVAVVPGLPTLHVDRLRLRQVLLNLLTNAARFTERGSITVAAALTDGWVRVSVTDTGQGISEDHLTRVFEEFYHDGGEPPSTTDRHTGIGLGLPLSRRLVELHGGHLGATSAAGQGTTFWFDLPVLASATALTSPRPSSASHPTGRHDAERSLVVTDPDPQFLDFLRRHLNAYQVVGAPDLPAAQSLAAEMSAFAILTDAPLATVVHQPTVPIIVAPLPRGAYLGLERGILAHLIKPVTRADLHAALQRLTGPLERVFIVDDDRRFVRLLQRMLQGSPLRPTRPVRVAHDGRTALAALTSEPPDLVLLDLTLPDLDGTDVVAAMRADPNLASVPIIIISAKDRLLAEFPVRGPVSIIKPDGLRPEEFLQLVDAILARLSPAVPNRAGNEERPPDQQEVTAVATPNEMV